MKQVAKKSTTSVPRKFSAENHQPNGLLPIQQSSDEKVSANITSNTSPASSKDASSGCTALRKILNTKCSDQRKDDHLTNGLHDSCERVLGNGAGYSNIMPNTNKVSAATDAVQQQAVEHSACTVTSAIQLRVSTADVQLPTLLPTSSNAEHSKSSKDVPVKHVSAATAKPLSCTPSAATLSNSQDDVIIVKADVDIKSDVHCTKRPISPVDDKKVEVKKARLDGALGQSVKVDGNDQLSRKVQIIYSSS